MSSASSTLSNSYTPLPLSLQASPKERTYGDITSACRPPQSLRRILMDTSILSQSSGSSIIELGHTKVVCSVHGPRSSSSSFGQTKFHSDGILNCEVRYAPNFGIRAETKALEKNQVFEGKRSGLTPEEIELSARLEDSLMASIPLNKLPKSVLDIYVMVLQGDGSIFSAAVMSASLALADAGLELYDLVSCCTVAVKSIEGIPICLADPSEDEMSEAEGIVTIAMLGNWKEVTVWNQTGRLDSEVLKRTVDLCRDGCSILYKCMKQCLTQKCD